MNPPAPPEISTLSLHDALPILTGNFAVDFADKAGSTGISSVSYALSIPANGTLSGLIDSQSHQNDVLVQVKDRKSTRLNSSHMSISYAVFCLKKKKNKKRRE